MKINLIGPQSEEQSRDVDYQKTQNWYPSAAPTGKNKLVLYPTPGSNQFTLVGTGPIRGSIVFNDLLWVISADKLYSVNSSGGATERGTLNTSGGTVKMAHNGAENGNQIIIVDGTNGYIWDNEYSSFFVIEEKSTGTTDGDTTDKLVDSGATFQDDGVKAGMVVYNTTDQTQTTVSAVDSQTQLTLEDDIFDSAEDYEIGDADFPNGATHVIFFDSFFLVNDPNNSGRFYKSNSYDGSAWDALDFATAERDPDELVAITASGREIWLLGKNTTEFWYNSGNAAFPFEPIQNAFLEWGCAAPYSVAQSDGTVFWLGRNENGDAVVLKASGFKPQVISTLSIINEINGFSNITNAEAFILQWYGHVWYVITFPTADRTLVYDNTMQMWFEWSTNGGRYLANTHAFVFNKHIVGDFLENRLYELDADTYTDNGQTITRIRRSPHIHNDDVPIFHHSLWVETETGVGNFTDSEPEMMLRWSDDGGYTWSNEYWKTLGATGEYNKKAIWRRLGRSYDRIYELKFTDNLYCNVISAYARANPGNRDI